VACGEGTRVMKTKKSAAYDDIAATLKELDEA
jgi:hypothetical protein